MRLLTLGLLLITIACQSNDSKDTVKKMGVNNSSVDSIELDLQIVYGSSDSVFIKGHIADFAVDEQGRVFIVASVPGKVGIYVFSPEGDYLETFSRYGRGPGEFESVSSIEVFQDQLYVYDPRLQKYSVFSLHDFTHIYDESIQKPHIENDVFFQLMRGSQLHVLDESNLLIQFQVNKLYDINIHPFTRFYKININGDIQPDKILELKKYRYYLNSPKPGNDGTRYPFTARFTRTSLFTHSDSIIYSAWTENFLIQKYSNDGELLDSIQFPFRKASLNLNDLQINNWKNKEIQKQEVPKTWPALYTIEADDEGRIWISTITESDSTFNWYVINDKKEIIGQFEYPGNKKNISVRSKPAIVIKNGFFYIHEYSYENGIDRVLKFKIE